MTGDTRRLASEWRLDPDVRFLNHGSFGACPRPILDEQQGWRERMERQPVDFFVRDLPGLVDSTRERVAAFLGAEPAGLAFVPNATTAVNAVLRSFPWRAGDEIVLTNHGYNACQNVADFVAERSGARVVVAPVPFPLDGAETVVAAVFQAVTERTRLVLIDHITSPTGLVFPVERLTAQLRQRGIDVLVDGAHAPGQLPLELTELGATYYTGNFHKWVCAPKGAAFLYVDAGRRDQVRPAVISHGANAPLGRRSRFHWEFDWVGTVDPTPFLCLPKAIDWMGGLLPGGWNTLRAHNRQLLLTGRRRICDALGVDPPAPEDMIAQLAAIPLPDGADETPESPLYGDPLQLELLQRFGVEVPIVPWPCSHNRLIRISAQVYNRPEDYEVLAGALRELLGVGGGRDCGS